MIASGVYKKALVIGAETLSRILNWEDRNTCVLFGDGAGAAVLGEVEEGYGISEIAFAVGRSEPAVMQQIEKMDLYQRTLNPKRHKSPPKAPTCLCDSCSLDLSACPRCEAHLSVQEVE